ncbi:glucosamine-6-phosphate deaminase [Corynebacterium bovis]|uniref:Glucosamine-6-phosphate deaminase n=1 Tax=Corynebacterium bovis DSM 20582 = CIP 54.80 TaxID=927655 RepID=A0A8H9Y6H6_9CORY|nr:glucosamine-6-phosphate deaminase [Corynebacterium bovis]MBB3115310.1 glucosamine-6-phosphate deaminase [Corynebacterium bovis DSM 20582 = CIP 54.80]RRO79714.1 glucosamine-6-phosphate deaminase [Corynebacterium bovis]RRO80097.1 glucosamine-6-phosphate deaminase [Corynebacterium bovis]RRO84212.1 glucosamine-6-phosphate deaminase [Corynebacterium bovis]RRO92706.1 glucosamine-6-phosphate deaminase [Corynebacterium bovis]
MEIIVERTPADVAVTAADIVAAHVTGAERPVLGLATGSTPLPTYRELIRRHREEGLRFARCRAYLLDEYVGLPAAHPQSYHATIRREFTAHVDIPDAAVHSPDGTAADLDAECARYDREVTAQGVDVQLLGVGTDGHIGFNEPGSALDSPTRPTTLHPQTVRDNARFFGSEDAVPRHVLTQGLGTILRAGHLLLLATGAAKAGPVAALVGGPVTTTCPASVLQLHPRATVVLDAEAAAGLG